MVPFFINRVILAKEVQNLSIMKILLSLILIIGFCQFVFLKKDKSWSVAERIENEIPPGTIYLGENLYYDQTEITNHHWSAYMYYYLDRYGYKSLEFKATLPDTLCWNIMGPEYDSIRHPKIDYYLRHPAYRDFPVVGVYQKQAQGFAKWRSDRVMEYALIKAGVFVEDTNMNSENIFTIEKYFKGNYKGIQPDPRFMVYPKYSLPSVIEYGRVTEYADSLHKKGLATPSLYGRKFKKFDFGDNIDGNYSKLNSLYCEDMASAFYQWHSSKKGNFYHLVGNVAEWSSEPNITLGCSWITKTEEMDSLMVYKESNKASYYTGFRNVCQWKKWKGEY
jgi:hypothetical protein